MSKLPELEVLKRLYSEGSSVQDLATRFGVSKKLVLNALHTLPDWEELRDTTHKLKLQKKAESRLIHCICEHCGTDFTANRTRPYCSKNCRLRKWNRAYRAENKDIINQRKKERRAKLEKKLSVKAEWEHQFLQKVSQHHVRNKEKVVAKILKRIDSVKNSLVTRSKKYNVECNVTIEDLRQLIFEAYGQKCKYCDKKLVINTLVIDHIMPISKGGSSNKNNLQVICKTSNSMKGSLDEASFQILLDWLQTIPEDLRKDISIRLSHGIH